MAEIKYNENGDAVVFTGKEAVNVYAMAVIASALRMYAKTGMQVNRAYTPKAMMKAAEHYLGRTFKARAYTEAAEALSAKVQEVKAKLAADAEGK